MRARVLGVAVLTLALATLVVSFSEGTPARLPGIALGSAVLLHAERGLALLGVAIAALGVVMQAARGRLPIEVSTSGLRYEADAADTAAAAVTDLQEQLDDLEATIAALADQLDAVSHRP
jgi:cytochrome b561